MLSSPAIPFRSFYFIYPGNVNQTSIKCWPLNQKGNRSNKINKNNLLSHHYKIASAYSLPNKCCLHYITTVNLREKILCRSYFLAADIIQDQHHGSQANQQFNECMENRKVA